VLIFLLPWHNSFFDAKIITMINELQYLKGSHAGPHENTINHITYSANREMTKYYWTLYTDTETYVSNNDYTLQYHS
jgi:hypothetical protein